MRKIIGIIIWIDAKDGPVDCVSRDKMVEKLK